MCTADTTEDQPARDESLDGLGDAAGDVLSEAYRAAIARLESLDQNQSGSDKTWVEEALESSRRHLQSAVRVR